MLQFLQDNDRRIFRDLLPHLSAATTLPHVRDTERKNVMLQMHAVYATRSPTSGRARTRLPRSRASSPALATRSSDTRVITPERRTQKHSHLLLASDRLERLPALHRRDDLRIQRLEPPLRRNYRRTIPRQRRVRHRGIQLLPLTLEGIDAVR